MDMQHITIIVTAIVIIVIIGISMQIIITIDIVSPVMKIDLLEPQ
jgi:hypothetical protein